MQFCKNDARSFLQLRVIHALPQARRFVERTARSFNKPSHHFGRQLKKTTKSFHQETIREKAHVATVQSITATTAEASGSRRCFNLIIDALKLNGLTTISACLVFRSRTLAGWRRPRVSGDFVPARAECRQCRCDRGLLTRKPASA